MNVRWHRFLSGHFLMKYFMEDYVLKNSDWPYMPVDEQAIGDAKRAMNNPASHMLVASIAISRPNSNKHCEKYALKIKFRQEGLQKNLRSNVLNALALRLLLLLACDQNG